MEKNELFSNFSYVDEDYGGMDEKELDDAQIEEEDAVDRQKKLDAMIQGIVLPESDDDEEQILEEQVYDFLWNPLGGWIFFAGRIGTGQVQSRQRDEEQQEVEATHGDFGPEDGDFQSRRWAPAACRQTSSRRISTEGGIHELLWNIHHVRFFFF